MSIPAFPFCVLYHPEDRGYPSNPWPLRHLGRTARAEDPVSSTIPTSGCRPRFPAGRPEIPCLSCGPRSRQAGPIGGKWRNRRQITLPSSLFIGNSTSTRSGSYRNTNTSAS